MARKLAHRCKKCRRSFKSKSGLGTHMLWHTRNTEQVAKGGKNMAKSKAAKARKRDLDGQFNTQVPLTQAQVDTLMPGAHTDPGHGNVNRYTGRAKALRVLDAMLSEAPTLQALKDDLRAKLQQDPTAFFRTIVMPNLPREALLRLEAEATQSGAPPILVTLTPREELPPDPDEPDEPPTLRYVDSKPVPATDVPTNEGEQNAASG